MKNERMGDVDISRVMLRVGEEERGSKKNLFLNSRRLYMIIDFTSVNESSWISSWRDV
jgi:hypothetical protein